jgi:diguanylate cyclase (GGDEF)-like protein
MRMNLEHASKIDGSTGVLNKSAFCDAAKNLLAGTNGQMLSSVGFVFMDLDYLKKLNDTLGHVFGDMAIADTAKMLQSVWRKTDLIGRFGGDEFVMLVPTSSQKEIEAIRDNIRASLDQECRRDGSGLALQISLGYAPNVEKSTTRSLLKQADAAMYNDKQARQAARK